MILATSATIQIAAAIASSLFDQLGPYGTSSFRFTLAAVIIVAVIRPSVRGRDGATWAGIAAYGASLAVLNLSFFGAIDRLPLGIAVTFAFVAPVISAIAASRRRADIGFALLAAAGVAVLGGIDRPDSAGGVVLALLAGTAWVGVAYAARQVGRRTRGFEGLALALPISALICLPFGVSHVGDIDGRALGLCLVVAVGGLLVPYGLELAALRRLEPRTVAVVYSVDPAIAAVVGLVALGQHLSLGQVAGMVAVIVASAGTTLSIEPVPRAGSPPSLEGYVSPHE